MPRFSLAAVLVAVTLCGVGFWYWYRVPFAVEHADVPVAFENDPLWLGPPARGRQIEHRRRLWGGRSIRHGSLTTFDGQGQRVAVEHFEEGVLHGPYQRWYADGHLAVEGQYERGQPQGQWIWHSRFAEPPAGFDEGTAPAWFWADLEEWQADAQSGPVALEHKYGRGVFSWNDGVPDGRWEWFDPDETRYLLLVFSAGRLRGGDMDKLDQRLAQLWREGGIASPRHRHMLLRPCNFETRNLHFKDVVHRVELMTDVPLLIDWKRIETAQIVLDERLSCSSQNLPLIAAAKVIVADLPLVMDLRYGTLVITPASGVEEWRDRTGLAFLGTSANDPLSAILEQPAKLDFIETPLDRCLAFIGRQHNLEFDLRELPPERVRTPVTNVLYGLSLRNALGLLFDELELHCTSRGRTVVLAEQE